MRLAGCRSDAPDGSVVAIFLFVHRHAHKGDARTVGRDLRIARPNEIEQVLLSNVPLLRQSRNDEQRDIDQDKQ